MLEIINATKDVKIQYEMLNENKYHYEIKHIFIKAMSDWYEIKNLSDLHAYADVLVRCDLLDRKQLK